MEPGVLDGNAGCESKSLGQCFVLVAERGRTLLVGQIEISVDVVSNPHRDAQERRHGRVSGGKTIAARVLFEMLEAQRLRAR